MHDKHTLLLCAMIALPAVAGALCMLMRSAKAALTSMTTGIVGAATLGCLAIVQTARYGAHIGAVDMALSRCIIGL
jgi:hypothetical protein